MAIRYEDLKNCAALAREARNLQTLVDWYRDMASCPTPVTQGIPVQSGAASPDRIGEWVDKIGETVERFTRTMDAYLDHVALVEQAIAEVSDSEQRTILRLRYLDGLTWDAISERTHIHERWCRELHKRAMEEIDAKSQDSREKPTTV